MKYFILLILQFCTLNKLFAQAGTLDSTFDYDGIATLPNGGAGSVSIQSDGKIILGGGWDNYSLLRFNSDGSIDSSFGVNGITTTLMGVGSNSAAGIVIQPDGKVLQAGTCVNNSFVVSFALARFNADGTLDNTFSNDGKVFTSFHNPAIHDDGRTIALQPDGKIIQVGRGFTGAPTSFFAVARFNNDGTLDNSFGSGGKVLTYVGPNPLPDANSVIVQPDGKILVGGMSWSDPGPSCFGLVRYNADGDLDNTFGIGGIVSTYFGDGSSTDRDEGRGMALQTDGKILMTGGSYSGAIQIVRYNSTGSLDSSFGINGKVMAMTDSVGYQSYSINLQQDQRILVSGHAYGDSNMYHNYFMLARFNPNGSPDSTFGTNGIIILSIGSGSSGASDATMQSDGKIVVAGGANGVGWVAARFLSGLNVGVLTLSSNDPPTLIYPNPIQSQATLQYTLTNAEYITISLYNMEGSKAQTFIINETRNQGEHKEILDLDEALPSGEYILSISNGVHSQGIKIVKQ